MQQACVYIKCCSPGRTCVCAFQVAQQCMRACHCVVLRLNSSHPKHMPCVIAGLMSYIWSDTYSHVQPYRGMGPRQACVSHAVYLHISPSQLLTF